MMCLNGETCVDSVAEYTCTCNAGFKGANCEISNYLFSTSDNLTYRFWKPWNLSSFPVGILQSVQIPVHAKHIILKYLTVTKWKYLICISQFLL